ncbi:HTH_Tnp_Tc3_2 domain-containing protein [Trichonephila clavipes]|nr:HTH_Tnp_Tc3_2 domain-containing protein [Trichonephila clavipes]
MEWPACSPDMNPIEHVWGALGRRVAGRQPPPQTFQELERALLEEWDRIPQLVINSLIDSMPQRIIKHVRRATFPQIAADFRAGPSASATKRTIQRNIIHMGFLRRRPTRVPLLTARHKALRLAWTLQHRHWTVKDWKYVAWSDASLVSI